jgi:hypothetical protein
MRRSHNGAPDAPGIGSYRLGRSRVCAKLHTRRSGPAASKGGVIPLYPQSIECGCAILDSDQKWTVPLLRVLGASVPPPRQSWRPCTCADETPADVPASLGSLFLQAEEATKASNPDANIAISGPRPQPDDRNCEDTMQKSAGEKKKPCKNCEGKGTLKKGDKVVRCQRCGGTGIKPS